VLTQSVQISVIVPVYNGRAFLREAVQSILAEEFPSLEVILVDDGSTDGSLETVADLPVRRLRLEKNGGIPGALNAGLKIARGRYITFLDQDDRIVPGGIRWRLDWLNAHPEVAALAGRPAGIIDENGVPVPELAHVLTPGYVMPEKLTLDFFERGGNYPAPMWNYIFHRSLIEQVGEFDETFKIACDFQYLVRVLARTDIPVVNRGIVERRLHGENLSLRRSGKVYELQPETIQECLKILAPIGVVPNEWPIWENGFTFSAPN